MNANTNDQTALTVSVISAARAVTLAHCSAEHEATAHRVLARAAGRAERAGKDELADELRSTSEVIRDAHRRAQHCPDVWPELVGYARILARMA